MKAHHSIELLESRIALAADFTIEILRVVLPGLTVLPEDTGSVTFRVTNSGSSVAAGLTGMHLYMSTDAFLSGNDPKIGNVESIQFNLGPGRSQTFTGSIKIASATIPFPSFPLGPFKVLAEADAGHRIPESNEGNNVAFSSETFNYALKFGTFDDRKNAVLRVRDGDGTAASFSIVGAGAGQLLPGGGKVDVSTSGTSASSVLRLTTGGGDGAVQLDDFTFGAPLKDVNMPGANISGAFLLPDGVRSVVVKNIFANAANRVIGVAGGDASSPASTWQFGTVTDRSFRVPSGVFSLSADAWLNVDAPAESMGAAFITELKIKNDFAPNLLLDGSVVPAGFSFGRTLGTATIGGEILGATWRVGSLAVPGSSGGVGKIAADATPANWSFDAVGVVSKLAIPTMRGSIGADIFESVVAETSLTATLTAHHADGRGYALLTLTAGEVAGANIVAREGGIFTVSVASWVNGGKIEALFLRDLETREGGDFSADLDLAIAGKTTADLPLLVSDSLRLAKIRGKITGGTWETMTDVGSLSVGGAPNWTLTVPGEVSSIFSKGDLNAQMTAWRIFNIDVEGELRGAITFNLPDPAGQLAMIRLEAGAVNGLNVLVPPTAGITEVKVKSWDGGGIDTGWLRRLFVGTKTTGDFIADITLHRGQASRLALPDGDGLTTAKIAGTFTGAIEAPDTVALGEVTMGAVSNGTIDAGAADAIDVRGDFSGNIQLRALDGQLNQFTVGGALTNSIVTVAHRIRNIGLGSMLNSHIGSQDDPATIDVTGALTDSSIRSSQPSSFLSKKPTIGVGGMVGSTIELAAGVRRFEIRDNADAVFRGSDVIAKNFGVVVLRGVDTANGGTPFGITAADYIADYFRYVGSGVVKLFDLEAPGTYGVVNDFRLLVT